MYILVHTDERGQTQVDSVSKDGPLSHKSSCVQILLYEQNFSCALDITVGISHVYLNLMLLAESNRL